MKTLDLFRDEAETIAVASNETIFLEGSEGGVMYVILEGSVKLSLSNRTLEKVGPGGFFGEMSVIDAAPRSATATAVTACRLVPIKDSRFEALVRESPEFALEIMRVMARRLRSMDSRI